MSDGMNQRGTVLRLVGIVVGAIFGLVGVMIAGNPQAVLSMKPETATFVGGIMGFLGVVACAGIAWSFHSVTQARKDYLNAHDKLITELTTDLDLDEYLVIVEEEIDDLPDFKPRKYSNRPEFQAAVANVKRELRDLGTVEKTSEAIIPLGEVTQIIELARTMLAAKTPPPPASTPKPPPALPPERPPGTSAETPPTKPLTPAKKAAKKGAKPASAPAQVTDYKPAHALPVGMNHAYAVYCEPYTLDDGTVVKKFLLFTELPEEDELRQVPYYLRKLKGLPFWMSIETRAARCWLTEIGRVETTEDTIPVYCVDMSHRMARDRVRAAIHDHEDHRLMDNITNRYISLISEKLDKATDDHNSLVQRAESAEAMLEQEQETNGKLRKQVVAEHAKQAEVASNPYTAKALAAGCAICGVLGFFISLGVFK